MNIGGRIKKRLRELNWERKTLLEKIPDLTPQALSNLIVRDSKRSEWDVELAKALGVDLLWLVYGIDTKLNHRAGDDHAAYGHILSDDELLIVTAFKTFKGDRREDWLDVAHKAINKIRATTKQPA